MGDAGKADDPRPGRIWFVLAVLFPVLAGSAFHGAELVSQYAVQVLGEILSFLAAAAFLFGTWKSIGTRTRLVWLEIDVPSDPTLRQGKVRLGSQDSREILDAIWWEWRAYVIGASCLFTVLVLRLA
jgi:hypothetical protein